MKEAVLASKRLYPVGVYRREWTAFNVLLLLLLINHCYRPVDKRGCWKLL